MPELDLGNVVGPKGDQGDTGPRGEQGVQGPPGAAATINGLPAITITPGQNVELKQEGSDLEIGAMVPGKQLLINADFRNPVNRNGEMEYAAVGYTIDQWYLRRQGNQTAKISLMPRGIRLTSESPDNPGAFALNQRLKDAAPILGRTVTFSILVAENNTTTPLNFCGLSAADSVDTNSVGLVYFSIPAGATGLFSATGTIPSTLSKSGITVGAIGFNSGACDITITGAKLELGSHQTLARQNEDGECEIIDPPDYDLQYLLCSQYSPITGEWVGSQHSNPNLLDNWYFADPINQRRKVEYIGNGYTIDRWRIADGGKLTIENSGISFTGQSANLYDNFRQIIEADRMQSGKTYTFSLLYKSDNRDFTLTVRNINVSANANLPATNGDFNLVSVQFVANFPVETFWVGILREIIGSTNSIFLKAAKLELGPVQTLAHKEGDTWVLNDPPPDKALELARCQRYQVETLPGITRYGRVGTGYGYGEFGAYIQCPVPVQLRARPTVKYSGGLYLVSVNAPGTTIPISSITVDDVSTSLVTLRVISDGVTLTKGQAYELLAFNDAAAALLFDANL